MINTYLDTQNIIELWDDSTTKKSNLFGKYCVVSGNTGAGKSTLIKSVTDYARKNNMQVTGINERVLHHPLLKLMFYSPVEYSFMIQLNFLLQRHLLLYRHLSMGNNVLIERSHLDDPLFIEDHLEKGNISSDEYHAYMMLSKQLNLKLPDPDLYIYLDVPPEVSLKRLKIAEETGERPMEFPNDEVKEAYVRSWYNKFELYFKGLIDQKKRSLRFSSMIVHRFPAETPNDIIVEVVVNFLAGNNR